jgi:hypothetical protein
MLGRVMVLCMNAKANSTQHHNEQSLGEGHHDEQLLGGGEPWTQEHPFLKAMTVTPYKNPKP